MKRYDKTILFPTIASAVIGVLLAVFSMFQENDWVINLLLGLGINVFSIALTLLLVDMYRWYTKKNTYKQSYEVLKENLLGVLTHPVSWLLINKYAKSESERRVKIRALKFHNEETLSQVIQYTANEMIRLVEKDSALDNIKDISKGEAEWLSEIIGEKIESLDYITQTYAHLIDDPGLIDQIAKLRGNMTNALSALEYLSGDTRVAMNNSTAHQYIKFMFISYVGLVLLIRSY